MQRYFSRRRGLLLAVMILALIPRGVHHGWAQNRSAEIEALRKQVEQLSTQSRDGEIEVLKRQIEELRRKEAERQQQIEELQRKIEELQAQPRAKQPAEPPLSPLERAVQELETTPPGPPTQPTPPALLSQQVGGARFRLIDISADLLVAAGGSSRSDDDLQNLQGGAHDPNRNGFTLQQLELSLAGAVDPYFTGEVHILYAINAEGEQVVELEEAFATTQSLPFGLEVEAGYALTEFGLINPRHVHNWDWIDQPVINSRIFGPDGQRQVGMRVGWLAPLPWFSQFHAGVQNANGETMPSFCGAFEAGGGHGHGGGEEEEEEETVGQRPFVECEVESPLDLVYLVRWENAWDIGRTVTAKLGASSLFGPNASGPDGRTTVFGADLKVTWRPVNNFRGWPFLRWETEFIQRNFEADNFVAEAAEDEGHAHEDEEGHEHVENEEIDDDTLRDWGVYTQLLYGFTYRWAAGLRFEYADGNGPSVEEGRSQDPFRDQRMRLSPLLAFYPTEFSRLRLQYNYDWADHLDGENTAHTVWLGLEILYGAHPAHKY
jgi:hypothetical protein